MAEEKKNIFITVAGSTPQIITESLYDLIVQKKINIAEVHIITTLHGEERCNDLVFTFPNGAFYRFCSAYNLRPTDIKIEIPVIEDQDGKKLHDIRNTSENEIAADFIDEKIRTLSEREDVRLLGSLSGGRKSMSAYMAYAMQLYARRDDRLFHVLIEPECLESNPYFFFPPARGESFSFTNRKKEEETIPAEKIKITNAEIPFLRVRRFLDFDRDLESPSYTDRVQRTQKTIDEAFKPKVVFDIENKEKDKWLTVILDQQVWNIHMKPQELAIYKYIHDKGSIVNDDPSENEHAQVLLKIYGKLRPETNNSFTRKDIGDAISKINKALTEQISNPLVLSFIKIEITKRKPSVYRFGKE